jgi:glutaredoxin
MPDVIVYSKDDCPWCVKVKDFLKQNNVGFEERPVEGNPAYVSEVFSKSKGYSLPVTDAKGTIIVGFNAKKLKEALGLP